VSETARMGNLEIHSCNRFLFTDSMESSDFTSSGCALYISPYCFSTSHDFNLEYLSTSCFLFLLNILLLLIGNYQEIVWICSHNSKDPLSENVVAAVTNTNQHNTKVSTSAQARSIYY